MYYYGGRLFRPVSTEGQSDTTSETIFRYRPSLRRWKTENYACMSVGNGQAAIRVKAEVL